MGVLVDPPVPAGHLGARAQPTLSAGELVLRPWGAADAPA
jgi:hypothetical protein